jgi:hypothetical protein
MADTERTEQGLTRADLEDDQDLALGYGVLRALTKDDPGAADRAMAERNRELIAERLHWPPGALDSIRAIEAACPGHEAAWFGDWTVPGFERAAGFYAWRTEDRDPGQMVYAGDGTAGRWVQRHEVYGVTADQLAKALGGKLP